MLIGRSRSVSLSGKVVDVGGSYGAVVVQFASFSSWDTPFPEEVKKILEEPPHTTTRGRAV